MNKIYLSLAMFFVALFWHGLQPSTGTIFLSFTSGMYFAFEYAMYQRGH